MLTDPTPRDNLNGHLVPPAALESSPKASNELPCSSIRIECEPPEPINVAAGGKLVVPREDIDADLDEEEEMDLTPVQSIKIRRPNRHDWIVIQRESELTVKLLVIKFDPDDFAEEYYYVEPNLRGPIQDELKFARVLLYYSLRSNTHALWVVKVTVGHKTYESINKLLMTPTEKFTQKCVRVIYSKSQKHYEAKWKKFTTAVNWPQRSMEELLGEALGTDHVIKTRDHPLYRELTEGEEVA